MKFNKLVLVFILIASLAACRPVRSSSLSPILSNQGESAILFEDHVLLKELTTQPEVDRGFHLIDIQETLHYTVNAHLTLVNQGPGQTSKHYLWLALIQSISPYQVVESVRITAQDYQLITDEYNNLYAQFSFESLPIGEIQVIEIEYQVAVNRLKYDFRNCEGPLLNSFLEPELHIEVNNPDIAKLVNQLEPKNTPCDRVWAFYNYVGESLIYTYNGNNWGAQAALGPMGADCTEYASLLIALCRNASIPARYLEGIIYQGLHPDIEAQQEHAWVEVFFPEVGWVAIDPTLGRLPATRDRYFGNFPADHIIVTIGRNPSTLRGNSYFSHLYWGSDQTTIKILDFQWQIQPINNQKGAE